MENKYVIAIAVLIFIILFAAGSLFGDQQIEIAGCTARWRTFATTVQQSELCSQSSCVAQPADQQHNAIVNALLCACDKAKTNNYANAETNKRIEDAVNLALNYRITAKDVCEQPGLILVKRAYG